MSLLAAVFAGTGLGCFLTSLAYHLRDRRLRRQQQPPGPLPVRATDARWSDGKPAVLQISAGHPHEPWVRPSWDPDDTEDDLRAWIRKISG